MITERKVKLRVNGMQVRDSTLRRGEKKMEVVIADSLIGEVVIDESFTVDRWSLFTRMKSEADCQAAAGGEFHCGF